MSYDYVRVEIADSYGISRGLLTTKENLDHHFNKGLSLNISGIFGMTAAAETIEGTGSSSAIGYCDGFFYPDIKTLKILPWIPDTASILGDYRLLPNDPSSAQIFACSRGVLKSALEKLNDLNLRLYGAYEYEFYLYEAKTKNTFTDTNDHMVTSVHSEYEYLAKDIMNNLKKCGITPQSFLIEYGVGQMEITYAPSYDVDIADNALRFKQIVKEMCKKYDFYASFMSKPTAIKSGSSAHLNHSLWNEEGKNVFYDPTDENNLSRVAKHWLAGLQYHSAALLCLEAATPNCFQRLNTAFTPKSNVWGIDNRTVCYRVKNYDESRTYIENRLPGAGTNQHLALAAMIYAGVDGINRKLELKQEPFRGDATTIKDAETCPEGVFMLPKSLKEAMHFLNTSSLFRECLGEEFLKSFNVLRNHEIMKFEEANAKGTQWQWQTKQYFKYM